MRELYNIGQNKFRKAWIFRAVIITRWFNLMLLSNCFLNGDGVYVPVTLNYRAFRTREPPRPYKTWRLQDREDIYPY
jgi:hypothetical protein